MVVGFIIRRDPMTYRRNRSSVSRRKGATAVELVVCLPLLILLCLTSVDFGRFAYAYITLGNAARVGAELGATREYSESTAAQFEQQIENAVQEEFTSVGGLDASKLDIAIDVAMDDSDADLHRVSVTTTYSFSTVLSWPGIPRPLELQRFVAYRRFR